MGRGLRCPSSSSPRRRCRRPLRRPPAGPGQRGPNAPGHQMAAASCRCAAAPPCRHRSVSAAPGLRLLQERRPWVSAPNAWRGAEVAAGLCRRHRIPPGAPGVAVRCPRGLPAGRGCRRELPARGLNRRVQHAFQWCFGAEWFLVRVIG